MPVTTAATQEDLIASAHHAVTMQKKQLKKQQLNKIAIDLMGGEHPPHVLVENLLPSLIEVKDIIFVFYGVQEIGKLIDKIITKFPSLRNSVAFVEAPEIIYLEDSPLLAVRRKQQSSLCLAMRDLADHRLDALVTCGNTGSLVAAGNKYLDSFPGILRPALSAMLPTEKQSMVVLDVGANIHPKAQHLIQYAQLGAALLKAQGKPNPKIGLLNIGSEAVKGTSILREVYQALSSQKDFQFVGNIEAKEAFSGDIDGLITDGFSGNIFLKTSEGIAHFVLGRVEKKLALSTDELFPDLQKHLHFSKYPGALLLGFNKLVVKCHSYAKSQAISSAALAANQMLKKQLLSKLETFLKF
jgi:phosphate acyltransferase